MVFRTISAASVGIATIRMGIMISSSLCFLVWSCFFLLSMDVILPWPLFLFYPSTAFKLFRSATGKFDTAASAVMCPIRDRKYVESGESSAATLEFRILPARRCPEARRRLLDLLCACFRRAGCALPLRQGTWQDSLLAPGLSK